MEDRLRKIIMNIYLATFPQNKIAYPLSRCLIKHLQLSTIPDTLANISYLRGTL